MVDKTEEEKEIWKTYSDYPFIEASNLGRIRTKDRYVTVKGQGKRLVKGKVLKQRLRPDGYMEVNFRVNNKPVKLLAHRVIATSHLPNPNNLPEVNHKDNDRTITQYQIWNGVLVNTTKIIKKNMECQLQKWWDGQ